MVNDFGWKQFRMSMVLRQGKRSDNNRNLNFPEEAGVFAHEITMKILALKTSFLTCFALAAFWLLAGCHVMLISPYDETTEQTATTLQKSFTAAFIKIERSIGTADAGYDKYIPFYDAAHVEISSLALRAEALPKSRILSEQIALLKTNLANLEQLHKLGFSSVKELIPLENAFNSAFGAIIRLELALKEGRKK